MKNKSEIYYRILEIGVENLEYGLTLTELKEKLPQEFRQFDNTINSYFSILFQPVDETLHQKGVINYWGTSPNPLENLNNNKFRLNHEMSTEFIKLNNSKNQIDLLQNQLKTTEQNAQDAKKESSWAFKLAIGSMILSGLGVFIDYLGYKQNEYQNKTTTETTSKRQTEINQNIYNLPNSLGNQTSNDRKENNKPVEDSSTFLKTTLKNNLKSEKK